MISRSEIRRSLAAVWFLFLGRPDAIRLFDTSIDGFWKSFQAILLVAPVYASSVLADQQAYLDTLEPGAAFDSTAYFTARAITLALDWVTIPVLLALLAPALGIRNGYSAYVVARNWATVLTSIPFALISLLDLAGLVPGEAILFPAGVALAVSLRTSYLAARRALAVPIDLAIGYVALDVLVSIGLARGVAHLLDVPV